MCECFRFLNRARSYNAYNRPTDATHPSNVTIAGVGLSTLWCPSDPQRPDSGEPIGPSAYLGYTIGSQASAINCLPGTWCQTQTSYPVSAGPVNHTAQVPSGSQYSAIGHIVSIASITDGTSNTMLFTESAGGFRHR